MRSSIMCPARRVRACVSGGPCVRALQEEFREQIEEAGFKEVTYENILGGVVALHSGYKL
jgi:hypothetical protein